MNTDSLSLPDNPAFGAFLRERRTRLDAVALGFPTHRRRTPGLRREEVALRAHISATWYSWLEQGRGGAPSAPVLERIANALLLTDVEREHLFLLGLGRPPAVRYRPADGVTPRLQHVLDALDGCPALVRTATWDVVAWNAAAAVVLTDYGLLAPHERNVLRLIFLGSQARASNVDWEGVARFVVGVFRADAARAGAAEVVQPLVDELSAKSADFARLWSDREVRGFGEGVKHLRHPLLGALALEYSAFAVDGRPDLAMLVYTPAHAVDRDRIRALVAARGEQSERATTKERTPDATTSTADDAAARATRESTTAATLRTTDGRAPSPKNGRPVPRVSPRARAAR